MAMKVYGASTAGVRNGSMGFDDETLEPTYVLRLGAPGKSAGLDIAGRLGLDPALIEAARARMTSSERDVSRFLAELHAAHGRAGARNAREIAAREQAVDSAGASLEQTWERKYAAKIRELEQRAAELARAVRAARARDHRRAEPEGAREDRQDHARISGSGGSARAGVRGRQLAVPPKLKLEEGARVRLKGSASPPRFAGCWRRD